MERDKRGAPIDVQLNSGESSSPAEEERPIQFESETATKVFESLIDFFIEDYMAKKYVAEKSGWRTLTEIASKTLIPTSVLYGRHSIIGAALEEPIRRGLIETRIFPGERGRGGEVTRLRIAYEKEPIKEFVNRKALHGTSAMLKATTQISTSQTATPEVQMTQQDKRRIAVLPFSSMSPDPGDEYFADGLTEELISTISRISGLRVISRTSVMQYKNTRKQLKQIGHDLKVGTVIEGSIRKAGNRIRITVQLLDVQTDDHLWSERYDRELDDIFEIQSDIARQVAKLLQVQLVKGEKKQIERIATKNTEAYTLYLKARYAWTERTELGLSKAIRHLTHAIEKDPNFALAYSGLADCYSATAVYGFLPKETLSKVRQYSLKAIEIDNSLAEAHNSLAAELVLFENNWNESKKEFLKATDLNPNYVTAHQWFAQFLAMFGETEEAINETEKARQLDPISPTTSVTFAMLFLYRGLAERAIEELGSYLEMNPNYLPATLWLGISYIAGSRFEEAISKIKQTVEHFPISRVALGYAYARAGMKEEALNQISELLKNARIQYEFVCISAIYSALGMEEEASQVFDNAVANKIVEHDFRYRFFPWWVSRVKVDQMLHNEVTKGNLSSERKI